MTEESPRLDPATVQDSEDPREAGGQPATPPNTRAGLQYRTDDGALIRHRIVEDDDGVFYVEETWLAESREWRQVGGRGVRSFRTLGSVAGDDRDLCLSCCKRIANETGATIQL